MLSVLQFLPCPNTIPLIFMTSLTIIIVLHIYILICLQFSLTSVASMYMGFGLTT